MATRFVLDKAAAKRLESFIVLKDGVYIAKVLVYYSGRKVLVNVFNFSDANKSQCTLPFLSARGDSLAEALQGLRIDGIQLRGYCERGNANTPGVHPANFSSTINAHTDWYYSPGLALLTDLGYTVIQAL